MIKVGTASRKYYIIQVNSINETFFISLLSMTETLACLACSYEGRFKLQLEMVKRKADQIFKISLEEVKGILQRNHIRQRKFLTAKK